MNNAKNDSEKLASEFYDFLKLGDYFVSTPQFNPVVEWSIIQRLRCQKFGNVNIMEFITDKIKEFEILCKESVPATELEDTLDTIPYELLMSPMLSQFEALKRLFGFALEPKKLGLYSAITTTYGTIISKLKKQGLNDETVCMLDNKLRNILAHGTWYVEDRNFTYIDGDEKHQISFDIMYQRVTDFTVFSGKFYSLYWHDYTPKNALDFAGAKILSGRL